MVMRFANMEYVKYFPPVTADKPHVTHLPKLIFCLLETPGIDVPIWVIGEAHTKCGWREEVGRYCILIHKSAQSFCQHSYGLIDSRSSEV